MVRTIKAVFAFAALAGAFLLQPSVPAQDSMKQDDMKQEKTQDHKMTHDGKAKRLETGKLASVANRTA